MSGEKEPPARAGNPGAGEEAETNTTSIIPQERKRCQALPPCAPGLIFNQITHEVRPLRCKQRSCPRCRRVMAQRYANQIRVEGITTMIEIDRSEWAALKRKLQRKKKPYKSFPRPGDRILVVADIEEGDPLPTDDLVEFLDRLIEEVPHGRRLAGSHGFGGSWAGNRAGNKEGTWRHFRVYIGDVRDALEIVAQRLEHEAGVLQESATSSPMVVKGVDDPEGFLEEMSY